MGRLDFWALASLTLVRKDLWLCGDVLAVVLSVLFSLSCAAFGDAMRRVQYVSCCRSRAELRPIVNFVIVAVRLSLSRRGNRIAAIALIASHTHAIRTPRRGSAILHTGILNDCRVVGGCR